MTLFMDGMICLYPVELVLRILFVIEIGTSLVCTKYAFTKSRFIKSNETDGYTYWLKDGYMNNFVYQREIDHTFTNG